MRRIVLHRVDSWLLLATTVGLFGCPLLLDDHFSRLTLSEPDAGEVCIGAGCVPPSDGVGGTSGTGGAGSGSSGAAGSADTASSAGAGGVGGTGGNAAGAGGTGSGGTGSGGTAAGAAGADGSAGQGGAEAACWTLELTFSTYGEASNCLGVNGTSNVVVDTGTTLALSYESGDPCFTGTIASTGWGAIYELTFAGDGQNGTWNASDAGVTGFEFAYRGSVQPSSLRVLYKDPSGVDNCRVIGPGSTSVPFSAAHPDCNSGATVDSSRMDEMILAFTPKAQPYNVDFCVQLRALD